MTRFFVPSRGVTHQWTVKEMASHNDFVFLDMSATYQTIGSQVVRSPEPTPELLQRLQDDSPALEVHHHLSTCMLTTSPTLCPAMACVFMSTTLSQV